MCKKFIMKLKFEDIKNIVSLHKSRNLTYIELYKKFYMWVMDRQVELDRKKETTWLANISSPVTYMICMAVFGMYQDSKVAFEVYKIIKKAKWDKITDQEHQEAELISNALITMFDNIYDKSDGSEEFDASVLDAIILGNGFWGVGYEQSEDEYEVIWEWGKIETIEEKFSMPNIYRVIPLNFFTETSAASMRKAKINVVRKIKTRGRINKDYGIYWVNYTKKENDGEVIEWKDRNMVFRFMMFNNMPWRTTTNALGLGNTYWNNGWTWFDWQKHTDIWSDNSYKIGEDLNEVYEVHTDKTIQVFVNGEDLGVFKRLGPWKEKPFYKLGFRDWLNGLYDMGVGMLSYPFHKVTDAFLNLRIDNNRMIASQPMLVNSDETAFDWTDLLERYPWKVLKVKDINESIRSMSVWSDWAGVANMEVDALWQAVQNAVGVSWYKMWIQQKVERSARGVQELVESADAAMKSFINSIAKAKWFIAKYVIMLALHYMDDVTIEKMSGVSGLKEKVDLTDFINDFVFNFNIESVSSLRERQEVESLKDFLRDTQWMTRPDWTPLIDIDVAVQELIEKKRLNSELYMDEEKAKKYMQEQIQSNSELQWQEQLMMPPTGWDGGESLIEWVMSEPGVAEPWAMGMAGEPGVQAWSAGQGMAQVLNPTWNNQTWQMV